MPENDDADDEGLLLGVMPHEGRVRILLLNYDHTVHRAYKILPDSAYVLAQRFTVAAMKAEEYGGD